MAKLSTCEGQNYLRQAAGNLDDLRGSHNLRRQLNLRDERQPPRLTATSAGCSTSGERQPSLYPATLVVFHFLQGHMEHGTAVWSMATSCRW